MFVIFHKMTLSMLSGALFMQPNIPVLNSGIPCNKWDDTFRLVGLTRPRSSGCKLRAEIQNQVEDLLPYLPFFTCLMTLKVKQMMY